MAPRGGMRPVDDRSAIGTAAVHRHRGRVRHSFGRSGVLTLAADAAGAALAANAALAALAAADAAFAALAADAAIAAFAAVATGLAALAAVAARLAVLAAVRDAPSHPAQTHTHRVHNLAVCHLAVAHPHSSLPLGLDLCVSTNTRDDSVLTKHGPAPRLSPRRRGSQNPDEVGATRQGR